MSPNKYLPHVLVLPEDDANRQLANGFLLDDSLASQNIQVLIEAGGWIEVLDLFTSVHQREMERFPLRRMVLLIDFDDRLDRLNEATQRIPIHLRERVFVLGALSEPEALKAADLGSFETIGLAMAKDCRENTEAIWSHGLLRHNAGELARLRQHVRPILFPSV